MTDDELIKHAQDVFKTGQTFQDDNFKDKWIKNKDLYDSKFSAKERKTSDVLLGQGRLFIPKTYSHTQRILVDILETFFFDMDEIVSIANWKNIPTENKEIVKNLLNYRLNGNPINFYIESYESILDALITGCGIFKVYPQIKIKTVTTTHLDTDGNIYNIEEDVIDYFAPVIESVPYEDVLFAPQATWKDYWKFPIVHRMKKSKDYLTRMGYKNLDDIPTITDITPDEIKQQRYSGSPFVQTPSPTDETGEIYTYEFWDFLDVNEDGLLESVSYLMVGDFNQPMKVIRDVKENTLPYKRIGDLYNRPPIVLGNAYPESHKLIGKSLPEIVESLQKEVNSLRNQRREAVALALRKPILYSRGAGLDTQSLSNRRIGALVAGDDISPSAVRELDVQDATRSSAEDSMTVNNEFFETTSIPPNLLGASSSPDETATAVTSHIANANKKIVMAVKNIATTLIIPAIKLLLRLEQEYENDEFIQLVTGRMLGWGISGDNIPTKEYIQGEFDLTVNLGVNKQIQLNKLMMILDRMIQVNAVEGQLLQAGVADPSNVQFGNPVTVFKRMLSVLGEKNHNEFFIQSKAPIQITNGNIGGSPPAAPQGMDAEVTNLNPENAMLAGM